MKKLCIVLAIALLASPVWAARVLIEVKADYSTATQMPDGTWNGVKYVTPELPDGDTTGWNFDGWYGDDLTRCEKEKWPAARIYIRVSDDMLKAVDADKDITIKTLIDDDAKALEKDLPAFSATLLVTK